MATVQEGGGSATYAVSEWTDGGTGTQMHAQHTRTTTSTQAKSKPPKIQRRKPAEDQDVQGYP